MSLPSAVASGAGRIVRWGLHDVLGRSASQLPGRVALAIDPNLIADLAPKVREGSVVVCGTNGKTTTNNVVASALEAAGKSVLCNRDGANMAAGVASALLSGPSADWAVIEADELSCVHILPGLRPTYLVLLNLFRDQLDRAGEIEHVQDTLVSALASSPETTLVACGDDPLCVGVARRAAAAGTRVLFFGIDEDLHLPADRVPEARFCQACGAELSYAWRAYAQMGDFSCPNCDFARPALDAAATGVSVSRSGVSFDAAGSLVGDPAYRPENGRLQRFVVNGREVTLNLAKNPTGFNQNISLLQADERPKAVLFSINDNFNDGRDISWIWDVDFERLAAEKGLVALAGGTRAADVRVRLKYAGIDSAVTPAVEGALARVASLPDDMPLYVLTNYSALWPAKATLERLGERHD